MVSGGVLFFASLSFLVWYDAMNSLLFGQCTYYSELLVRVPAGSWEDWDTVDSSI